MCSWASLILLARIIAVARKVRTPDIGESDLKGVNEERFDYVYGAALKAAP